MNQRETRNHFKRTACAHRTVGAERSRRGAGWRFARVARAIAFGIAIAALAACGATRGSGGSTGSAANLGQGEAGASVQDGSVGLASNDGSLGVVVAPDAMAIMALAIAPSHPVLTVTVTDGAVTNIALAGATIASLPFTASLGAASVTAAWSIDRGELGTLDPKAGGFTPNGRYAGAANVTATYGNLSATTVLTIQLHLVQNGGSASPDGDGGAPGAGGYGGVGGEGPGGPVDDATVATLRSGSAKTPASEGELGLLYPYDGTVWPRGVLPPLVQWQTTHSAAAAYIHLTERDFEFEGFYAGANLVHQPIDPLAWRAALDSNTGDPLELELRIADAAGVVGPRAERFVIAKGVLKGTVYYDSYSTMLADKLPGASSAAAILAIRAGARSPVLALPGSKGQCTVCHSVSDDGSTLFAPSANLANVAAEDYSNGASYDLRDGGAIIASYPSDLPGSPATAPDGTPNNRKFLWSGLWRDGTFALQSSGHTQEAYAGDSRVFRRDTGSAQTATGFDRRIAQAVTPAFSRDGTRVAFDYWQGTLAPGGGNGQTLDVMDFACGTAAGAAAGAPSCTTFVFSNLRRLYSNPDTVNGFVGWPAWLPDSSGVVFHNTTALPKNAGDSPLSTWHGAKAELWFTDVPVAAGVAPQPVRLDALNGDGPGGTSVLPRATGVTGHDDDNRMNYEPTVNPLVSGGYAWVVFTSRRMYGNVASGDPYQAPDGQTPVTKKLWIAAIDEHPAPGHDPSHPAFYLPGQELLAGNMRGFWVVDPCLADGATCETGDECCGGFCRPTPDRTLACGSSVPGCAQEYEKCTDTSNCCQAATGFECVNHICAAPAPPR